MLKMRKIAFRPASKQLCYSVLGCYVAAVVACIWLTFTAVQDWVFHREVMMQRSRTTVYDIEYTETQLQLVAFSAVAASVFLVPSVKLFTRIRSDGKNITLNLVSTLLLASPLALFSLPQPWSSLVPAVMVASTVLIDDYLMNKQVANQERATVHDPSVSS